MARKTAESETRILLPGDVDVDSLEFRVAVPKPRGGPKCDLIRACRYRTARRKLGNTFRDEIEVRVPHKTLTESGIALGDSVTLSFAESNGYSWVKIRADKAGRMSTKSANKSNTSAMIKFTPGENSGTWDRPDGPLAEVEKVSPGQIVFAFKSL